MVCAAQGTYRDAMEFSEIAERFRSTTLSFILSELEVADTFAQIALETDDRERALRNRQNARKGYDTALHFLATINVAPDERTQIEERLDPLKEKLLELGESV